MFLNVNKNLNKWCNSLSSRFFFRKLFKRNQDLFVIKIFKCFRIHLNSFQTIPIIAIGHVFRLMFVNHQYRSSSSSITVTMLNIYVEVFTSQVLTSRWQSVKNTAASLSPNPTWNPQLICQTKRFLKKSNIVYSKTKVFNGVSVNTASSVAATGLLTCPSCQDSCPATRPCRWPPYHSYWAFFSGKSAGKNVKWEGDKEIPR